MNFVCHDKPFPSQPSQTFPKVLKVSLFLSLMFTGVDAPKSSPFVFLCAYKEKKPKQAGTAILGKGDVSAADLIYWSLTNNSLL